MLSEEELNKWKSCKNGDIVYCSYERDGYSCTLLIKIVLLIYRRNLRNNDNELKLFFKIISSDNIGLLSGYKIYDDWPQNMNHVTKESLDRIGYSKEDINVIYDIKERLEPNIVWYNVDLEGNCYSRCKLKIIENYDKENN